MKLVKRMLAAALLAMAVVPSLAHAGDEPPGPACLPPPAYEVFENPYPCDYGFTQWVEDATGVQMPAPPK